MFTFSENNLLRWCFLTLLLLLVCDNSLSFSAQVFTNTTVKVEESDNKHSSENVTTLKIKNNCTSTSDTKIACTPGQIIEENHPKKSNNKSHSKETTNTSKENDNVTKINTTKKCYLLDGTPYSCKSEEQHEDRINNVKETMNTSKENDRINVTKINTLKKNCTEMLANGTITHCTENALINLSVPTNSSKEIKNATQIIISSTTESTEIASMTDHAHKYTGGMDVDELKPVKNNSTNSSQQNQKIHPTTTNGTNSSKNLENSTTDEHGTHVELHESVKKMQTTTAAGIAAGICILFGITAYISLILWRKISYARYGNREMLLNEDDLGDIHDEDMRHFEAACIQIET